MLKWTALVFALMACEISASGTDREKAVHEMEEHDKRMRQGEALQRFNERQMRYADEVETRYKARFKGQVQPGVGCDACPDICAEVDLRPMEPAAFQASYRRASHDKYNANKPVSSLAALEAYRLACMATAAGEPLRSALVELMDDDEQGLTRVDAAYDAIEHRLAPLRGLMVLLVLARGEGPDAVQATGILVDFGDGVWPEDPSQPDSEP